MSREKESNKRWRDKHPTYDRDRLLRIRHGITQKQFQEMLDDQLGKCKICGKELVVSKLTHIDHDHKTGATRGLLCHNCNRGLGYFHDDLALLISAHEYLVDSQKTQ